MAIQFKLQPFMLAGAIEEPIWFEYAFCHDQTNLTDKLSLDCDSDAILLRILR